MKINQALKGYFAKAYFKNFSYLVGENFVRLILGFFVSILVARHLGPGEYGELNYILSCIHILIPLYTFGIDEFMLKNLVAASTSDSSGSTALDIMKIGFWVKAFGALLAVFSLYLLSEVKVYQFTGETQLLALAYSMAMVFRSFDVIDNWYQAKMEIRKLSYARTTVLVLAAALKLFYIFLDQSWLAFLFVSAVEIVLVEILYVAIYFQDNFRLFFKLSGKTLSRYKDEIISTALPVIGVSFLTYAIARVDQIMIGNMLGDYELGKFAVAVKLVDIWQFLPFAVINSFYPVIIRSFTEHDEKIYERKLVKLYGALAFISLSFSITVYFIAPYLINLLYGAEYSGAGDYLSLYCWLTIPVFYLHALVKILVLEKKVVVYLYLLALTFVLNLVLNFLLIPKLGVQGAIIAALSSYAVSLLCGALLSITLRKNQFNYFKSLLGLVGFLKS